MAEEDLDGLSSGAASMDDDFDDADWGSAMAEQGVDVDEDMMAQWSAMLDEDPAEEEEESDSSSDRILNQDEIDSLLGFEVDETLFGDNTGIRAIINSALVSYERLPMLEIIFDRLVRLLTTSLRNFTSDNVEVSFDGIRSVRFGDYLNSIPLPAIIGVVKAREWDSYCLATVESNLIYSIIDVLLGGRRKQGGVRVEGRPYTTIEMSLIRRMIEVVLSDFELAFEPLTSASFQIDRMETNPRFATITRPANAAVMVQLRIDMEDRGGNIEIMIPYASIEPIRELLLQMYMGEKLGRDFVWENHFATEVYHSIAEVDAILCEQFVPLQTLLQLKVGDTIPLDLTQDDPVSLKCGDVVLTEGVVGQKGEKVALQITRSLRRSRVTMESFETKDVAMSM